MSEEDVPALVYEGDYSEVLFLKTLIEAAGIETSLYDMHPSQGPVVTSFPQSAIYVRRVDVEHARELAADFLKNGKRTDPW